MGRELFARALSSSGVVLSVLIAGAASASTPTVVQQIPKFETASCNFKDEAADWPQKNGVSCGWVTVKAHHEKSDSPTLRLWVVKVAAKGAGGAPNPPLIRLWYGPMAANIDATALKGAQLTALLRPTRDVVFFDYRGMGRSEPNMACTVPSASGVTIDARLRSILAQSRKCRRQIEAKGTDLSALNAAAASQDVRDIAQAMQYPTYDIWGASYGSFPALDLIGERPTGLRAAIIGVAVPPDSTSREQFSSFALGLTAMQHECDANAQCHRRFPNMAGALGRAMARLDRERLMGRTRRLTPVDLLSALFGMGALAGRPDLVPLAIETAEKSNAALVTKWLDGAKDDNFGFPDMSAPDAAAQITLGCSSYAGSGPTRPDVEAAARQYPFLARATKPTDALDRICDVWKIAPPPRDLHQPVKSDIPILFYSARFDMAVLNSDTLRVARMLPHATIIEVPAAGHTFTDSCLINVEAAFLVNPLVLDRSCTVGMKPIKFAVDGFETYAASLAEH